MKTRTTKLKVPYNKEEGILCTLWRIGRAEPAIDLMAKYIDFKDKRVLDVGCGEGPISILAAARGAYVDAVDPNKFIHRAIKLCRSPRINFYKAFNEALPFKGETFDLIYSFDSLEHVKDVDKSLSEIHRCLRKNGVVYVEFSPYWSLVAGHHLYDFTLLPVQYLPKKLMKNYIMKKKPTGRDTPEQSWNYFENLNKLSIKRFYSLCKKYKFKILEEQFIVFYPDKFKINLQVLKYLGPLREAITMSYIAVIKKF